MQFVDVVVNRYSLLVTRGSCTSVSNYGSREAQKGVPQVTYFRIFSYVIGIYGTSCISDMTYR